VVEGQARLADVGKCCVHTPAGVCIECELAQACIVGTPTTR
jgi:hypothetical protein